MNVMTKKRTKAIAIDMTISSLAMLGIEQIFRKKIKSEAFHALVTPTLVSWTYEYLLLRVYGQTLGCKIMGLSLESEDGSRLTSGQIVKRLAYRDTVLPIRYLKIRGGFEENEGAQLLHDRFAGTVVREK